jgi:hypothetical protein
VHEVRLSADYSTVKSVESFDLSRIILQKRHAFPRDNSRKSILSAV